MTFAKKDIGLVPHYEVSAHLLLPSVKVAAENATGVSTLLVSVTWASNLAGLRNWVPREPLPLAQVDAPFHGPSMMGNLLHTYA